MVKDTVRVDFFFFFSFKLLHTSNVLCRPISGFANSCVTFLTLAAGTVEKLKGAFRCQTGASSESCVGGPKDESENLPSQSWISGRRSASRLQIQFAEWETNCCVLFEQRFCSRCLLHYVWWCSAVCDTQISANLSIWSLVVSFAAWFQKICREHKRVFCSHAK